MSTGMTTLTAYPTASAATFRLLELSERQATTCTQYKMPSPFSKEIFSMMNCLSRGGGAIQGLADRFVSVFRKVGYLAMSGQFLDTTIVAAPQAPQHR